MRILTATLIIFLTTYSSFSQSTGLKFNAFNQRKYTIESEHFRLHYGSGLKNVAEEIASILEKLYGIYRDRYHLVLPRKTDVLVSNDDQTNSYAIPFRNIINIWSHDFDWNMRGTGNWLENVVAHEYAHVVSIWASYKIPQEIPYIQFAKFSHMNDPKQTNMVYIFPNEILPQWFTEGIAQFESTTNNGDRWDTHRDMILRTKTLSNSLLSWSHMQTFTGKGYEYELTYNHGFSMIRYINEKYGYESIVSMLREASKFPRVNFDRAIKASLGITAKKLYSDWKNWLKIRYEKQLKNIGTQVFGRKISKNGYNNFRPKFAFNDTYLLYQSNGRSDFSSGPLMSYNLSDYSADTSKLYRPILPVLRGPYSLRQIDDSTETILYTGYKSRKSALPPNKGGYKTKDIFYDKLNHPEKKKKIFAKKEQKQLSERESVFQAVFSPTRDSIIYTKHEYDIVSIYLRDSSGSKVKKIYPPKGNDSLKIKSVYNLDWSDDGKLLAVDYLDRHDRKIAIYNISTQEFKIVADTKHDERDPVFSHDSKSIYFSSDRTGIFNIYKYDLENGAIFRLTNVSGGAFTPDISYDGKKLAYAGYDDGGYSIYLIDTIKVLDTLDSEKPILRKGINYPKISTDGLYRRKYFSFPNEFNVIPMLFTDETLTDKDNSFKGLKTLKIGAVAQLVDPFFWANRGNSFLAYFMFNPTESPFSTKEIINHKADFDFGFMASTQDLPVNLTVSYLMRQIAGSDYFKTDITGDTASDEIALHYSLDPSRVDLTVDHYLSEKTRFSLSTSYNKYSVWVKADDLGEGMNKFFKYTPIKGFTESFLFETENIRPDSRMDIAPRRKSVSLKYDFNVQRMQNEIRRFKVEDGMIKENYLAPYRYHQLTADLTYSASLPFGSKNNWLRRHVLSFSGEASGVYLAKSSKKELQKSVDNRELTNTNLPSYMQPSIALPGYTYYYKDTLETAYFKKGSSVIYKEKNYLDTTLISGNGVAGFSATYLFPLYPNLIDKKLGFIYFEYLYAALNFAGAVTANNIKDLLSKGRKDFFLSRGLEFRLSTIAFNSFPMAIDFRWDYGIDKPAPIGGHHIKFSLDFEFPKSLGFKKKSSVEEPSIVKDLIRRK